MFVGIILQSNTVLGNILLKSTKIKIRFYFYFVAFLLTLLNDLNYFMTKLIYD